MDMKDRLPLAKSATSSIDFEEHDVISAKDEADLELQSRSPFVQAS